MSLDEENVQRALAEARRRLTWLEDAGPRRARAHREGQKLLEQLRKRRTRGQVPMWEAAQRAALRTVVLALGCVLLITGAATLDGTLGGVAIVASFAVLLVEGLR